MTLEVSMPLQQKGSLDVALLCSKLETHQREQEAALRISMPLQQPGPLDIPLLCSKLETHQRQQEAARARRERRHAVKKGIYYPRSAAAQFTSTTTPAPGNGLQDFEPRRRASLPAIHSQTASTESAPAPEPANIELAHLDKIDSAQESPSPRTIRSYVGAMDEKEKTRGYVPGTAAKRRTSALPIEDPSTRKPARPSSFHPGMLEFPHNHRATANQEPRRKSETTAAETRKTETAVHRPNPLMYNRPDWAQQSQNGDEGANLLHLPRLGHREAPSRKPQQENRLVADAVKIIQEEQKVNRRRSVLGFFKKR